MSESDIAGRKLPQKPEYISPGDEVLEVHKSKYPKKVTRLQEIVGHHSAAIIEDNLHQQILGDYLSQGGGGIIAQIGEAVADAVTEEGRSSPILDFNQVASRIGLYIDASIRDYRGNWYGINRNHRIADQWRDKAVKLADALPENTTSRERLLAATDLSVIVARTILRGQHNSDLETFKEDYNSRVGELLGDNLLGLIGYAISYTDFCGIMTVPDPQLTKAVKFSLLKEDIIGEIGQMGPEEVYQNILTYLGYLLANKGLNPQDEYLYVVYQRLRWFSQVEKYRLGKQFQGVRLYLYDEDNHKLTKHALQISSLAVYGKELGILGNYFNKLEHPHRITRPAMMQLEEATRVLNPALIGSEEGLVLTPIVRLLGTSAGFRSKFGESPLVQRILGQKGEIDAQFAREASAAVLHVIERNWETIVTEGFI